MTAPTCMTLRFFGYSVAMDLELLIIAATDRAGNGLFTVNNSVCLLIAEGWRQRTTGRKESENYQSVTHGSLFFLPSACWGCVLNSARTSCTQGFLLKAGAQILALYHLPSLGRSNRRPTCSSPGFTCKNTIIKPKLILPPFSS